MASTDKRSTQRRRQLKAAIVAFNNRHSTVPARVREVSETGARLEVDPALVPDTFELLIDLDGLEAGCEVVWRKSNSVGVRFVGAPSRSAPRRIQVVTPTRPVATPSIRRKPVKD